VHHAKPPHTEDSFEPVLAAEDLRIRGQCHKLVVPLFHGESTRTRAGPKRIWSVSAQRSTTFAAPSKWRASASCSRARWIHRFSFVQQPVAAAPDSIEVQQPRSLPLGAEELSLANPAIEDLGQSGTVPRQRQLGWLTSPGPQVPLTINRMQRHPPSQAIKPHDLFEIFVDGGAPAGSEAPLRSLGSW
jgi:hypothetical protein